MGTSGEVLEKIIIPAADFKKGLKFAVDRLIMKYKNKYSDIFFDEIKDTSASFINTFSIGLKLLMESEPKDISVKSFFIDEKIKSEVSRVFNQLEIPEFYYTIVSDWNELLKQIFYFAEYNLVEFILKNHIYAKVLEVHPLKRKREAKILFIKNEFDRRIITIEYDGTHYKGDFYDYMFLNQESFSEAIIEYLEKD